MGKKIKLILDAEDGRAIHVEADGMELLMRMIVSFIGGYFRVDDNGTFTWQSGRPNSTDEVIILDGGNGNAK